MKHLITVALLASMVLVGCGGGGGGSSNPPPIPSAKVGGFWSGSVTVDGQDTYEVAGVIAEDGRAHFLREHLSHYWGTVTASGNTITANISGAVEYGTLFVDGSTSGSGSMSGTIAERKSITASITFTTERGTRTTATVSLTYASEYEADSSLSRVSGNYTFALDPGADSLNISSSGALFGQDPWTGCVVNGRVRTIDTNYNLYDVQFTFSNCNGIDAVLNGETFSGLGFLDLVTPEWLIVFTHGSVGGNQYGNTWLYERY